LPQRTDDPRHLGAIGLSFGLAVERVDGLGHTVAEAKAHAITAALERLDGSL
jgi:hypothetical protein